MPNLDPLNDPAAIKLRRMIYVVGFIAAAWLIFWVW